MNRVIIESPFAGNIPKNIAYARLCVRDSALRGEAPIASHLLFTQETILRDNVPEERKLGIEAGLAWIDVADFSAFYTNYGWSPGMLKALDLSIMRRLKFKLRSLYGDVLLPTTLNQTMFDLILDSVDTSRP